MSIRLSNYLFFNQCPPFIHSCLTIDQFPPSFNCPLFLPSIHPSVHPFIYPTIHPSTIHPSTNIYLTIQLPAWQLHVLHLNYFWEQVVKFLLKQTTLGRTEPKPYYWNSCNKVTKIKVNWIIASNVCIARGPQQNTYYRNFTWTLLAPDLLDPFLFLCLCLKSYRVTGGNMHYSHNRPGATEGKTNRPRTWVRQ